MEKIKLAVSRLIQKYKTNDPYEIADYRGIIVVRESLGSTLGYHNTYKRIPFIHINFDLSEIWQRFVCAHELGHNILHSKINTPFLRANTLLSINRIEREANEFAVELLAPDQLIYYNFQNTERTMQEIAAIYGIPQEFAQFKKLDTERRC